MRCRPDAGRAWRRAAHDRHAGRRLRPLLSDLSRTTYCCKSGIRTIQSRRFTVEVQGGTEPTMDEKKEARREGRQVKWLVQRVQRAVAYCRRPRCARRRRLPQIKELCERCLEAGAAATTSRTAEALHACDGDLDCAFAFLVGESVSAAGRGGEEGKAMARYAPGEAPRLPRGAPGPLGRRRRSSHHHDKGFCPADLSVQSSRTITT